ncbi:hypothetical protein NY10_845 [Carnobacterium antarcticum]|nr:hypothetical protein NY10_845 [Carnobacterium sp. CP1]
MTNKEIETENFHRSLLYVLCARQRWKFFYLECGTLKES